MIEQLVVPVDVFYRFGAALLMGFLVGLQREYAYGQDHEEEPKELFAGTRTFALLGLLGCTAAFVGDMAGSVAALVGLLLLTGLLIAIAYFLSAQRGDMGLTSEIAALLTLVAGTMCYWNQLSLAAALVVATTAVLSIKIQTQSLARSLTREDVYATLKFAIITAIILPVLPKEPFASSPFDVLIPYKIWLMVVFISGISFLGYVMMKLVGARRGVGLTGLLGGLASSTATTLSFSQQSRTVAGYDRSFAMAILLAWSVMFIRVIAEVAAINPPLLKILWIPLTAATVVSLAYCGYLYRSQEKDQQQSSKEFKNPFELGPAFSFGLLYAVILVGANAAMIYLGQAGLYLSSIGSGLVDVDAITLSMSELSRDPEALPHPLAARAIVLAAASNTIVKGSIVLSVGSPSLRKAILPGLVMTLATAIGIVFLM